MTSGIIGKETNNTQNMNLLTRLFRIITTRKELYSHEQQKKGKIWNYFDLISICVITSLGFGVFTLHGHIASQMSGPSTLVSYAIVAIIGLIVALCYIEFNCRIPIKSGSSYNFISTALPQFITFIIGWNLIADYVIAAACASRSFSQHLNALLENTLEEKFMEIASMNIDIFAKYFDFLAFGLPIIIAISIALGLKRYRISITIITVMNLIFLWFILIAGIVRAKSKNWRITTLLNNDGTIDSTIGEGGFMPFTITGTMQAASICIIIFIGYDSLTNTFNRETILLTKRKVPIAFFLSFGFLILMFIPISVTLTLMFPYYKQTENAWILYAFDSFGWDYAKYVGGIGGMIGIFSSIYFFLNSVVPIVKQMTYDGLIFKKFGGIIRKPHTPVLSILLVGVITGVLSGLFETTQLLNSLSLGTLFLFLSMCVSTIIRRYSCKSSKGKVTIGHIVLQLCNANCNSVPSTLTARLVEYFVVIYCFASLGLSLTLTISHKDILSGEIWAVVLASVFILLMLIFILGIAVQPEEPQKDIFFKVPLVPILPGIAIFMIVYLITMLHYANWIRFGMWTIIGLIIYFWGIYKRDCGVKNKSVMLTPSASSKELKEHENGINGTKKIETTKEPLKKIDEIKVTTLSEAKTKSPELEQKGLLLIAVKLIEDISSLHSSTKSYDEINSINEHQNNFREKKEPNGNVYFVENEKGGKNDSSENLSLKQDSDTRHVLAFLDDIIQDEEKRPQSVSFGDEEISAEVSTEAIVHREDAAKHEKPTFEDIPTTFYIPPPPPFPPPTKLQDSDSDDSEEGAQKREFKKRLTILYAEKSFGKTKSIRNWENERPILQHSQSDPDFKKRFHCENDTNLNHDISKSNPALAQDLNIANIPDPPKFDAAIFAEIGKKYNKPLKADSGNPIPEPPAFNLNLYRSLGKKTKNKVLSKTADNSMLTESSSTKLVIDTSHQSHPEIKIRKYSLKMQSEPLSPAMAPITDDENLDRKTIKQKLELIFQRGPPMKIPLAKPKSEPKPVEAQSTKLPEQSSYKYGNHISDDVNEDDFDNPNDIDPSMNSRKKPYDTVKLQKLRFDNVLKLIKNETKPGILRNNSLKRQLSNRSTNGLNVVKPSKTYLPDE